MIKGISYWSMKEGMAGTHSIDAALADAKAAGFEGLELAIATEGALTTDATEAECAEIRKKIDASGMVVKTTASGVAWGFSPTSNDPEVRAKSNELYAKMLQMTAWLGCEALLYLPAVVRSPIAPDECVRYDTAIERAHENIKQLGDVVGIVFSPSRPERCVLTSTLEASGFLLWSLTGAIAALILMIVLLGLFVHRSYAATHELTSRLDVDPSSVLCPECGAKMSEGYLALLAGLHWREIGEPIGMPHALSGLPGTVGWRGRPRLHAFRCEGCSVVTFKYGKSASPS